MNTIQTTFNIIDIHSHILYGVDHGSKSLEESIKMLEEAKQYGILDIICTPHYQDKNYSYNKNFNTLKKYAKKLNINLYTGNELQLNEDILEELREKKANTLNNTNYLLIETKRNTKYSFNEIRNLIQDLINNNYKVIIAHPELIQNAFKKKKELLELREMGVYFQITAGSFFLGYKYKRRINKLIKLDLVDFIASDIHRFKNNYKEMDELKNYIIKKYGLKYAKRIFYNNPKKIIK